MAPLRLNQNQVQDISENHSYGKPRVYEVDFNGLTKHSCTDVFCCFLFLAACVAWLIIAVIVFIYGDPQRLLYPTDSKGRLCGVKNEFYDLSGRPFLFFFDLTACASFVTALDGCPTPQVCVAQCPSDFYSLAEASLPLSFDFRNVLPFCTQEFARNNKDLSKEMLLRAVENRQCPGYFLPEKAVFRRCLPSLFETPDSKIAMSNRIDESFNKSKTIVVSERAKFPSSTSIAESESIVRILADAKEIGEKVWLDLSRVWWQMLIIIGIAMLISLIWIILMRWISGFMVWLSILLVFVCLGAGAGYSWWTWARLKAAVDTSDKSISAHPQATKYFSVPNVWLAIAVIVSAVFVIILLITLFLCKRIVLAIALIRESSRAVGHMLCSLLFPVLPFVLYVALFSFWATVAVFAESIGSPYCQIVNSGDISLPNGTICDCRNASYASEEANKLTALCTFADYSKNPNILRAQIYNLFALFWTMFFVSAFADMTLAGAFSSYYWAYNKPDDIPSMPIVQSMGRALKYHIGSMAFGSLILALVKLVRVFLEYLDEKLKRWNNPVAQCFLKCMMCFFWCLEKFLRFLTKNAYIMIAMHGASFCGGAKEAFNLIMRNAVRVWVLDKVTGFLLFIGKLLIVVGIGVLSGFYFSGYFGHATAEYVDGLHYYFVPIIIVVLASYLIVSSFFAVYEMAVDTTFLCFCEDLERNTGTPERPYYMTKELMRILSKTNATDPKSKAV